MACINFRTAATLYYMCLSVAVHLPNGYSTKAGIQGGSPGGTAHATMLRRRGNGKTAVQVQLLLGRARKRLAS